MYTVKQCYETSIYTSFSGDLKSLSHFPSYCHPLRSRPAEEQLRPYSQTLERAEGKLRRCGDAGTISSINPALSLRRTVRGQIRCFKGVGNVARGRNVAEKITQVYRDRMLRSEKRQDIALDDFYQCVLQGLLE